MDTPMEILEKSLPDDNHKQAESESEIEVRQIDAQAESENQIEIRQIDALVAAAELRLRAAEVNSMIASLDEAKVVTQETLQIEFRI
jgi:hypothetical protein